MDPAPRGSGQTRTGSKEREGGEKPVLFLVPGLMGCELEVGGRPVWIDPQALSQGDLERLDIRSARVQATGPLPYFYDPVVKHLRATHDVRVFAYDWRASLGDAAVQLAGQLRLALDQTVGSVRILAHSAGGLAALAMAHGDSELWARFVERSGSRLILVGTPLQGSWLIPRILLGSAPLVRALARLDFQSDEREVVRLFSDFPGILELLPESDKGLFSRDTWLDLPEEDGREDWIFPRSDSLESAREFRQNLTGAPHGHDHLVFVCGHHPHTPAALTIDDDEVTFSYSNRGDGVALWDGSVPKGSACWYMDAPHGEMLSSTAHFEALQELVETGTTKLLPTEPPVPASGEVVETVPEPELDRFPDWQYLATLATGWPPPRAPRRRVEPIEATVVHADLAASKYPLVVGHYVGDGIVNAEAALDYHLKRRLSRLYQLNLYPEAEGSCEVVLVNSEHESLSGAVVVGLGEVGSVSARSLTAAVRLGVVKYVEALRTAGEEDTRGLSFLIMGTSDGSLSIEASVRSCLRGVIRANRELSSYDESATVSSIEFVELFRDRAVQALEALRTVCGESEFIKGGTPKVQARPLRTDATGQRRVSFEPPKDWWSRLHIELDGEELCFTTPTSRARSEDSRVFIQADLIRRLLHQARDRKAVDEETPGALFQLLMSNQLKALMADRRDLVLVLDDGAAQFPWELLIDKFRGSSLPLCIGSGLVRSLRVKVTPPLDVSRRDTILVVGDPPSSWPALPGAQREALQVAERFKDAPTGVPGRNWDVTTQIHPADRISGSSVLRALMAKKYRILHLAGHGDFRKGQPTRTGMVIGSHEVKDRTAQGEPEHELQLLRPHEVLQMPAVPELVFINCCHLGRQESDSQYLRDRPLLAANLASQFIKNGVRAVVAAGWEVGDRSALMFSQQFYQKMLAGSTFGEAVKEARRHVYSNRRANDNTWGAFQCYGDPGFRLLPPDGSAEAARSRFFDTAQLLAELDNVVSRSKVKTGRRDRVERLKVHVTDIERRLRKDQRRDGTVLARLANAWSQLGDKGKAIELYERARTHASDGLSLTDLERLANLRARRAADRFNADDPPAGLDREEAAGEIATSAQELEQLLAIAESSERLSMLASTYKRLALVTPSSKERREAVARMTEYYARAIPLSPRDPYPLLNALGGVLLMGGPWKSPPSSLRFSDLATVEWFEASLERARALAEASQEASQDYWGRVHVHDLAVIEGLARGELVQRVGSVARGYRGLWNRFGSANELDSARSHLAFLVHVLSGSRTQRLAQLREQLPGLEALDAQLAKAGRAPS